MASAGDGDRPRLPDTDDPYALLGIAPDADVKAVRQAYARLIRIYRPDRAPKEFQRVHAAFEQAMSSARPRLERTGPSPSSTDAERPAQPPERAPERAAEHAAEAHERDRDRDRAAEIARRLDDAQRLLERGDRAAATAAIDALLDQRVPLDQLAAAPEGERLLVEHPTLSWTRLVRASGDIAAVFAIWDLAWHAALEGNLARARDLLDDERLRLDAADDPQLAALCMVRIAALVWTPCGGLPALLDRYRAAIPAHPLIDQMLEVAGLEIEAAARLRGVSTRARRLVDPLHALLATAPMGDLATRRGAARRLIAALEHNLDETLGDLDALHDELDLGPVFESIYVHLTAGATRLDALDKAAFEQLTRELYDLGREPHKWKVVGGALGATLLAGTGIGLLPGAAVFAGSVGLLLGTERMRYERHVRPGLARMLLRMPITTWVVSRWVQINGRLAGRLSRFDVAIDADRALYALSMLASAAIVIGELAEPDEASPEPS